METKKNLIVEKTVEFSVEIISFCQKLNQQNHFIISKQLLKSATSIGANVFEAQHAESRSDFIHKMKIAAKEAAETDYWFLLCEKSDIHFYDFKLKDKLNEIQRILSRIISSAKTG